MTNANPNIRPLYYWIAQEIQKQYRVDLEYRLSKFSEFLPSGSGLDAPVTFNIPASCVTPGCYSRIVLNCSFHHMDEYGSYDGWTDHKVEVKPCFINKLDIKITGKDRNEIKDYLADLFYSAMMQDIEALFDPTTRTFSYRVPYPKEQIQITV